MGKPVKIIAASSGILQFLEMKDIPDLLDTEGFFPANK